MSRSSGSANLLKVVVLPATIAVIAGLFLVEEITLLILWNILIPVLPASFLISARRFSLNQDGVVLGTLIVVIVVAALVLGFFFASKSGF